MKRVRAAKIHILIMGHLRKQMPSMMGKQKAQDKLLRDLPTHFAHVQREHHLPAGAPQRPAFTDASPWHGGSCAQLMRREGKLQHSMALCRVSRLSTRVPRRTSDPVMRIYCYTMAPCACIRQRLILAGECRSWNGGACRPMRVGVQLPTGRVHSHECGHSGTCPATKADRGLGTAKPIDFCMKGG